MVLWLAAGRDPWPRGNGVDWHRQPNPTLNQRLAPHPPTSAELFGLDDTPLAESEA
jgi:hypothetical protein